MNNANKLHSVVGKPSTVLYAIGLYRMHALGELILKKTLNHTIMLSFPPKLGHFRRNLIFF